MRFHIRFRSIIPSTCSAIIGLTTVFGCGSVAVLIAEENPTSSESVLNSDFPQKTDTPREDKKSERSQKDNRDKKRSGKHKSKGKHQKHHSMKRSEVVRPDFNRHAEHRNPGPGPIPQQLRGNKMFTPNMQNVPFTAMPSPIPPNAFLVSGANGQHAEILSTLKSIERSMKNIESMMRHERSGHEPQPQHVQPPFSGVPLHESGPQHGPGTQHGPGPQDFFGGQNLIPHQLQQGFRPQDMGPRHEPQPGRPHLLHDPRGPQTHPESRGDDRERPHSQELPVPYSPN